jgi:hypothetical protein
MNRKQELAPEDQMITKVCRSINLDRFGKRSI